MSSKNSNSSSNSKNRVHVLGIDAEIDPCIGHKKQRGVYSADRIPNFSKLSNMFCLMVALFWLFRDRSHF